MDIEQFLASFAVPEGRDPNSATTDADVLTVLKAMCPRVKDLYGFGRSTIIKVVVADLQVQQVRERERLATEQQTSNTTISTLEAQINALKAVE